MKLTPDLQTHTTIGYQLWLKAHYLRAAKKHVRFLLAQKAKVIAEILANPNITMAEAAAKTQSLQRALHASFDDERNAHNTYYGAREAYLQNDGPSYIHIEFPYAFHGEGTAHSLAQETCKQIKDLATFTAVHLQPNMAVVIAQAPNEKARKKIARIFTRGNAYYLHPTPGLCTLRPIPKHHIAA
jgi:hypothetical protein